MSGMGSVRREAGSEVDDSPTVDLVARLVEDRSGFLREDVTSAKALHSDVPNFKKRPMR
jgi:hypothetical protein